MRIIYVAYHYPPTGGAGVQRTVNFVRNLPNFGIDPVVLTAPGTNGERWTPKDPGLAAGISNEVEVHRARGPEPSLGSRQRRIATRWLRAPSAWAGWWREQILEVGRTLSGDLLLCSMSPFESAEAVAQLAAELGIPWVADLRDPWALDEMLTWPTTLHRRLEQRAMRRALSTASLVIMNTPTAADRLREAFVEFRNRYVAVIPNGFDLADFAGPGPERLGDGFHIVHTGYLHTELGLAHRRRSRLRRVLGGAERGVDFLTRSHIVLLEALDRLCALDPSFADRVHVWLAGVLSEADKNAIGSRRFVHELGYLPHERSVALMRSADLLFLPMHDVRPGARASIVPGKTYEYLAAGRPLLAAVPDGDARELVESCDQTFVCRPGDVDGMVQVITELARGPRLPTVQRAEIMHFDRRAVTAELAHALSLVPTAHRQLSDGRRRRVKPARPASRSS